MHENVMDQAYRMVVEERIHDLWAYRQWCRRQPNSAFWGPLRVEWEAELRALLRLARKARDISRPATAQYADKVTVPLWQ